MANPVRIYVLYHPDSALGKTLTDRIYDWFRLPTLEGIPVYVRSQLAIDKDMPANPEGINDALEYLVPLVDAHMVRDATWHDYLTKLAKRCLREHDGKTKGWVMFPVALDSTAFNLPERIAQRNFVRYIVPTAQPATALPVVADAEQATSSVLNDLTEAMSRDLNARLFPKQAGRKLKIFISYARADGSEVAKAMRDYIQSRTQCEAFFDENDIGFGRKYDTVLSQSAGVEARALIVVAGDHYADRPTCRWEIRQFSKPVRLPLKGAKLTGRHVHVFHPVMVLSHLNGAHPTRVIPELGQVPTLRWERGREMLCFSMLLRAVLFGARNVLAAKEAARGVQGIVLNRLPGPVLLQRLLSEHRPEALGSDDKPHIHYPGNGLPLMELRLLETTFKDTRLTAFRDVGHFLPEKLFTAMKKGQRPLNDRVICFSYSDSEKLNSLGYLTQHIEEALIYLLRPLLRLGADIMYGGMMPKRDLANGSSKRNMTLTLLNLLADEVNVAGIDVKEEKEIDNHNKRKSRLFNPNPWPRTELFSAEDEASWINSCSVIKFMPKDDELPATKLPEDAPQRRAVEGLVASRCRQTIAEGFACPVPGNAKRKVVPAAMVFLGGKMTDFRGTMPGIMEEFAFALQHGRPIFLLGGFGGAAGVLKDALVGKDKTPPAAFDPASYGHPKHVALLEGYKELNVPRDEQPKTKLATLWKDLVAARKEDVAKIYRNGLSKDDNDKLMTTTDTLEAVHLIWQGLEAILLPGKTKGDATH